MKTSPEEYLTIPISGDPELTINSESVKQDWCNRMMIKDVLRSDGEWKTEDSFPNGQRPISCELSALRNATELTIHKLEKHHLREQRRVPTARMFDASRPCLASCRRIRR